MNALSSLTRVASLFKSNRSQAVRIPKEFAFADTVKKVHIRRDGKALILTPVDDFWDRFFDEPGIDLGARDQPSPQECDWRL